MFRNGRKVVEEEDSDEFGSFTGEKIALLFAKKGKRPASEKW
jgi:hypothetical protein